MSEETNEGLEKYESMKGLSKLKGIRRKLCIANCFTPFITAIGGAYLGYELFEAISEYAGVEGSSLFFHMTGGLIGFCTGGYGGLNLACKIFDLFKPSKKEICEMGEKNRLEGLVEDINGSEYSRSSESEQILGE